MDVLQDKDAIQRRDDALELAHRHRNANAEGNKAWVLDQMCRVLLGAEYDQWVESMAAECGGADAIRWDAGIAPVLDVAL